MGKSSSLNRGGPCLVVPRIYDLEPDDIPELLQTRKSFAAFFGDIKQDLIFPEKGVVLLYCSVFVINLPRSLFNVYVGNSDWR